VRGFDVFVIQSTCARSTPTEGMLIMITLFRRLSAEG
jgi:hypothetical protein